MTVIGKARCATCDKEKGILKCEGCLLTFCYNHAVDHRQELNKKMENVIYKSDLIQQTLAERTIDLKNNSRMKEINDWEYKSIEKIRQTSEEARKELKHTADHITQVKVRLNNLMEEIRQSYQENNYYETDLHQWKSTLSQLEEELQFKSWNNKLQYDPIPLETKISFETPTRRLYVPQLSIPYRKEFRKWSQNGVTFAGGNRSGSGLTQLYHPLGICIDDNDRSVYVSDYWNSRILKWMRGAMSGELIVNGTLENTQTNHLNCPGDVIIDKENDSLIICDTGNRQIVQWPRCNNTVGKTIISDIECWGLAMDNQGYLYVSDYNRHEVRRWRIGDTEGTVVAGGNKQGNRLDQLNSPTNIFVDDEQSVYVSDRFNHRVMKWRLGAKEGEIVAGNQTEGNSMGQLSEPAGILVDQVGTVYVADSNNHRVMCWPKGSTKGNIIVGGNGCGGQSNQLYNPRGLAMDSQDNLYVVDNANHRIQRFSVDLMSNL
ncbi:unnamed protein product [Adineta steineri]|uniref:Uncharacterized protein n=1 Tax=Adineta steineri TaxID=433720 RepID=A0A815IK94_9BILA|nr:unnamed protein product [Adineta steineri]CAF3856534.1 unnamed protein product [Adineta steineri]